MPINIGQMYLYCVVGEMSHDHSLLMSDVDWLSSGRQTGDLAGHRSQARADPVLLDPSIDSNWLSICLAVFLTSCLLSPCYAV